MNNGQNDQKECSMSEKIKVISFNIDSQPAMFNLGSDQDAVLFFRTLFKYDTAAAPALTITEVDAPVYDENKYTTT